MKECFIERSFRKDSMALIEKANEIIAEYMADDFILTLRQLFYRMVAHAIIENKVQIYKNLGELVRNARYAGLIDWSAIEDRRREFKGLSHWDDPAEIVESAAHSFALDKWAGQGYRPELWIEKEALAGILQRAAEANDLSYLACCGYVSASEMYDAAQRVKRRRLNGQETVIIYAGDHDPSGLDMSESDIPGRFQTFLEKYGQDPVRVNRIALNWDQIQQYQPPPNFAKETDSRFAAYQKRFGDKSWELDALDPNAMLALIQAAIDEVKDADMYDEMKDREDGEREILSKASERWDDVASFLGEEERQ